MPQETVVFFVFFIRNTQILNYFKSIFKQMFIIDFINVNRLYHRYIFSKFAVENNSIKLY